jgi:flagellar biosynthesis/type III secretory pathway protein FliH
LSSVIKADRAAEFRSAPFFDLGDIEEQARAILAQAQARAAGIIDAATKEGDAMRKRAAEEGRRVGIEEGRKEGLKYGADEAREDAYAKAHDDIAALMSALMKAAGHFSEKKEALFLQAEKDLLALALLAARKIVGREIAADAHVTADNLKRCLDVLSSHKNLVVRVAPQTIETITARMPEFIRRFGDLSSVKIEGDPSVALGGCLITGESGLLDATIETQFAEVERVLFGESHE